MIMRVIKMCWISTHTGSILKSSSGPRSVPSAVKASLGFSAGESTTISSKSDGVLKTASVPSSQPAN